MCPIIAFLFESVQMLPLFSEISFNATYNLMLNRYKVRIKNKMYESNEESIKKSLFYLMFCLDVKCKQLWNEMFGLDIESALNNL